MIPAAARMPAGREAIRQVAVPQKVLIGCFTMGDTAPVPEFWESLFELKRPSNANLIRQPARTQADGREMLAQVAVEEGYTHVFMLDTDMVYPKMMLVDLLRAHKDVVCGFSLSRHTPHMPIFGVRGTEKYAYIPHWPTEDGRREGRLKTGYLRTALVGGAGLLISVDALLKIPRPWFTFPGEGFTGMSIGEDNYFSQKAEDHGVELWCSTKHRVEHMVKSWILPAWAPQEGQVEVGQWNMTVKGISGLYNGPLPGVKSTVPVDPDPAQESTPPMVIDHEAPEGE